MNAPAIVPVKRWAHNNALTLVWLNVIEILLLLILVLR
jgi:hypothetical protein